MPPTSPPVLSADVLHAALILLAGAATLIMALIGFIVKTMSKQLSDMQREVEAHGKTLAGLVESHNRMQTKLDLTEQRLYNAIMQPPHTQGQRGDA